MEQPIQIQPKQEREMDFFEIITIIWRARKFITIFTGILMIFGILYILFATPMYKSQITLYSAVDTGGNSPMSIMARQLGAGGAQTGATYYNIPDVVKSRTLAEKIVAHEWQIEGFDKKVVLSEYFNKIFEVEIPKTLKNESEISAWKERQFYSYSNYISADRIGVVANDKTGLITVSVKMESPVLARDIANFISLFVTSWVNDVQKEKIKQNLEFINDRAAVLGGELQQAENELKKFRETNRNILNSPDLQLEVQRLQRQVTIKQEVYLTMIKQREINQIEENKSVDVVKILDKAITNEIPYKPNKKNVLIAILFIGIILSSFFIVIFKILYTSLAKKYNELPSIFKFVNKILVK
ncbi:MAG: Wzz/FepE/Etk N-terminal domain-containing protein [Candidatus Delongbacteria bacterium]|jgi:uncharacterized protein involved in exopolysaccharide biosynthesis|nr:Wzz/FepE/Etk N-terminal domain-containing protein [Candidatus Delongbacteria bacterium]